MKDLVPHISGLAYIPLFMINREEKGIVQKLTIKPRGFQNRVVAPIDCYTYDKRGYLGIPIDYAIERFPDMQFEDRTVMGGECYYNKLPDPNHSNAAPGQADFMQQMEYAANNYFTFIAKAGTGSGKTACALRTAALRGRRTLAIVTSEQLARQWAKAINEHLGVALTDIGWVQSNTMGIEHPFVVGIVHSIANRLYPPEFYQAFGTVIYDEVHRMGAAFFAQSIGRFPSNLKIGLTATDRRKDGAENVFFYYFGRPKVIAKTVIRPCTVHTLSYTPSTRHKVPLWMENSGQILGVLCNDPDRNHFITRIVMKMYEKGRSILVLGDRVEHLQTIRDACVAAGIPQSVTGMFVDQLHTKERKPSYTAVETVRTGMSLFFWRKDDHQLKYKEEVIVGRGIGQTIEVRDSLGRVHSLSRDDLRQQTMVAKKVSVPDAELDRIKRESLIIFATYGMMKEGQDVPRLNAGIDATPRSDGEQAIGRVRRPYTGAPNAVWYTIKDQGHPVLARWSKSRIRDYNTAGAKVLTYGTVG